MSQRGKDIRKEGTNIDADGHTAAGKVPLVSGRGSSCTSGRSSPPAGCPQDRLVQVLPYSLPPMEVLWVSFSLSLNV